MDVDALLASLAHDHVGTSALLDEAAAAFEAWRAGTLAAPEARERVVEPLIALRDHLLDHFAAEEEALAELARFSSAELRRAIEALEREHAQICAIAVRLGNWAEAGGAPHALGLTEASLAFVELARRHAEHEPSEQAVLAALREALRGARPPAPQA